MDADKISEVLERVFFRIGSADTDEKFEKALENFLVPVLHELGSSKEGIRKKVLELLVHINKRLRSRLKVQLPVEALIRQYTDLKSPFIVTNFSIVYLRMGFPRLEQNVQLEFLPALLNSVEGKPQIQRDAVLHMSVPLLSVIQVNDNNRALYGMAEKSELRHYILHFYLCILLLPYVFQKPAKREEDNSCSLATNSLCELDFRRLAGDGCSFSSAEELEKARRGVVRFLSSHVHPAEEILVHMLVANADSRHSVVSEADKEVRYLAMIVDWENEYLLMQIFLLLLGSGKEESTRIRAELYRFPASHKIRIKVFPYLLRSKVAVTGRLLQYSAELVVECLEESEQNTNKLVSLGLDLLAHLATYCHGMLREFAQDLLSRLVLFMYRKSQEKMLKAKAFNVFGKLVSKCPSFVVDDLTLVQQLFDSLSEEKDEVKVAVQACLNSIASLFTSNESKSRNGLMEALLFENIEKSDPACRQVAIHFADVLYSKDHIPSRYIILQGLGDDDESVRLEANRAFAYCTTPEILRDIVDGSVAMPCFIDFVNHDTHYAKKNPFVDVKRLIPVVEFIRLCLLGQADGMRQPSQCPPAAAAAANDKQETVAATSLLVLPYEEPCEFRYRIARNVRYFMRPEAPANGRRAVDTYFRLIQVVILTQPVTANFPGYLEEVLVGHTRDLVSNCKQIFDKIKTNILLTARGANCRHECATIYALVVAETDTREAQFAAAQELISRASDTSADVDTRQGAALGAAYVLERSYLKLKGGIGVSGGPTSAAANKLSGKVKAALLSLSTAAEDLLRELATRMNLPGTHPNTTLALDALTALAHCGLLSHLAAGKNPATSTANLDNAASSEEPWLSKAALVRRLLQLAKGASTPSRVKEAALRSLGALCAGEACFPHSAALMEGLTRLSNLKELELQLAVGESLTAALLGSQSPYRGQWYDREYPARPVRRAAGTALSRQLFGLLQVTLNHSSPVTRQAGAAWTSVLLRRAGLQPDFNATQLQALLMNLLADHDEITQELAAKALGFLFEQCSSAPDTQQALVGELVDQLMHGKRRKLEDTVANSVVFAPGELVGTSNVDPASPLCTYKELCSLANEVNQPDLIYKLMNLASSHTQWATRRGAASGFAYIARQAGHQLQPHLAKLIPKLYRYQFDPNPRIQATMTHIWTTLTSSSVLGSKAAVALLVPVDVLPAPEAKKENAVMRSQRCIDCFLPEIMGDLKANLLSNQWRVREACCLALAHLLRSRPAECVVSELAWLWEQMFLLADDTRDSVRQATEGALRALSRLCQRLAEPQFQVLGQRCLADVVPVLLARGLPHQVAECRTLTLTTLTEVCRSALPLLRPSLPLLVQSLLEAVSALEPAMLNTLSQQLAGAGQVEARDKVDAMRAASARTSPMGELLRSCIQQVDAPTLAQLVAPLNDLIRGGIGLATKCAAAQFLCQLAVQCGSALSPHTGKFLAALLHGALDRNRTVQRDMAAAVGHLIRYAKESSAEKLLVRVSGWYFQTEEATHPLAAAFVFHAVALHAPDVLRAHASTSLPLMFIAKQGAASEQELESAMAAVTSSVPLPSTEEAEETAVRRQLWADAWIETCASTAASLTPVLAETQALCLECLQAQSWTLRRQAALALRTLTEADLDLGPESAAPAGQLAAALVQEITTGRYWPGKELLASALGELCVRHAVAVEASGQRRPAAEALVSALRPGRPPAMFRAVLSSLCRLSDSLSFSVFPAVWALARPLLDTDWFQNQQQKEVVEDLQLDKEDVEHSIARQEWREICAEAIGLCWPVAPRLPPAGEAGVPTELVEEPLLGQMEAATLQAELLNDVFVALRCVMLNGTWRAQLNALRSITLMLRKDAANELSEQWLSGLTAATFYGGAFQRCLEQLKYPSVREQLALLLEAVICAGGGVGAGCIMSSRQLPEPLRSQLLTLLASYRQDSNTATKERARILVQLLQVHDSH